MTFPQWPVLKIEAEKRRLVLLQYLDTTPGYEVSAGVLLLHLRRAGVPSSADQVEDALSWLHEQGLITLRWFNADAISRLTARGRDAAHGNVRVPGVLRPDP